jgi:hypothetical protein
MTVRTEVRNTSRSPWTSRHHTRVLTAPLDTAVDSNALRSFLQVAFSRGLAFFDRVGCVQAARWCTASRKSSVRLQSVGVIRMIGLTKVTIPLPIRMRQTRHVDRKSGELLSYPSTNRSLLFFLAVAHAVPFSLISRYNINIITVTATCKSRIPLPLEAQDKRQHEVLPPPSPCDPPRVSRTSPMPSNPPVIDTFPSSTPFKTVKSLRRHQMKSVTPSARRIRQGRRIA